MVDMHFLHCLQYIVKPVNEYISTFVFFFFLAPSPFHTFCFIPFRTVHTNHLRCDALALPFFTFSMLAPFVLCVLQETLVPQCDPGEDEMVCTWQGNISQSSSHWHLTIVNLLLSAVRVWCCFSACSWRWWQALQLSSSDDRLWYHWAGRSLKVASIQYTN